LDVITDSEREDLENIIDFRNDVAHAIQYLVADINSSNIAQGLVEIRGLEYDNGALNRLIAYKEKIEKNLGKNHLLEISMNSVIFSEAELTYNDELKKLKIRINKGIKKRASEIDAVN